jgi:hypothetical protein
MCGTRSNKKGIDRTKTLGYLTVGQPRRVSLRLFFSVRSYLMLSQFVHVGEF